MKTKNKLVTRLFAVALFMATSGLLFAQQEEPQGAVNENFDKERPVYQYMQDNVLPFYQSSQSALLNLLTEDEIGQLNALKAELSELENAKKRMARKAKASQNKRANQGTGFHQPKQDNQVAGNHQRQKNNSRDGKGFNRPHQNTGVNQPGRNNPAGVRNQPARPFHRENPRQYHPRRDSLMETYADIYLQTEEILMAHQEEVKEIMTGIKSEQEGWESEIKEIIKSNFEFCRDSLSNRKQFCDSVPKAMRAQKWRQGKNNHHMAGLRKTGPTKAGMRKGGQPNARPSRINPVALALWEGERLYQLNHYAASYRRVKMHEFKSTEEFEAYFDELNQYVIDEMIPVIKAQREAWNDILSDEEKQQINQARRMMKSAKMRNSEGRGKAAGPKKPIYQKDKELSQMPPVMQNDSIRPDKATTKNNRKRNVIIYKRAHQKVVAVAKNHQEDFKVMRVEMAQYQKEWRTDIKNISGKYYQDKDTAIIRMITRHYLDNKLGTIKNPVKFLLWDPDRKSRNKTDLKPLMTDIRDYIQKNVEPVIIPLRNSFDNELSLEEKETIENTRSLQMKRRELIAQLKNGNKEAKEELASLRNKLKENRKSIHEIAVHHKASLKDIFDGLQADRAVWRSDIHEMVTEYFEENDIDAPEKQGMGFRHLKKLLSPHGFILYSADIENNANEFQDELNEVEAEMKDGELKTTTAIDNNAAFSNSVQVYPSPASTSLFIEFQLKENADVSIDLFTINGKHYKSLMKDNYPAGDHKVDIDANALQSGYYLLNIRLNDSTRFNQKVYIE